MAEVHSVAFMSPSQLCSLLRNLCFPVSALLFCAICVAQSALLSFAQFMSPSQRSYLLRNLCSPFNAVLCCAIYVAQSALLYFAQFVFPI